MAKPRYDRFVSVACANFRTAWGHKPTNLERITAIVRAEAEKGSQLVIFPELALSAYGCDDAILERGAHAPCPMHRDLAETVPGPATRHVEELTRDLGVYVIFGMPERDHHDRSVVYNAAAVIGPRGLLGTYRKIHLAPPPNFTEALCFASGSRLPLWRTGCGPVGVLICYDFWYFPELSRILALRGARLIVNLAASSAGPGKALFIVQQTGCRATENTVFAATANLAGKDKGKPFAGHSVIAGPLAEVPAHIFAEAGETEEVIRTRLDMEDLRRREESMPWRRTRKGELIRRELSALLDPEGPS